MADAKRDAEERQPNERVNRLADLLDKFDEADGGQDSDRKFGIKVPYSDAQAPKSNYWAD